jgi:hypothetical protein
MRRYALAHRCRTFNKRIARLTCYRMSGNRRMPLPQEATTMTKPATHHNKAAAVTQVKNPAVTDTRRQQSETWTASNRYLLRANITASDDYVGYSNRIMYSTTVMRILACVPCASSQPMVDDVVILPPFGVTAEHCGPIAVTRHEF